MDVATRHARDAVLSAVRARTREVNARNWAADVLEDTTGMEDILGRLTVAEDASPIDLAQELGRILFINRCNAAEACGVCGKTVLGKRVKVTPCGHYFHSRCLTKRTTGERLRACPTCAEDVFPCDPARNRGPRSPASSPQAPLTVESSLSSGADDIDVEHGI